MTRRVAPLCLAVAIPWLCSGCPAEVTAMPSTQKAAPAAPAVPETDPRVAKVGEDLYPKKTVERTEELRHLPADDDAAPAAGSGLGSGRPDETNGKCRLYAPKLPDPECCAAQLGFDANAVKDACGLDIYLGESFQGSCGYYYLAKDGRQMWFRMSELAEESVQSAADNHMAQTAMKGAPPPDDMGIEGVKRATQSGLSWAFIPGYDGAVRMLTWRNEFCDEAAMKGLVGKLKDAKRPPKDGARPMIPAPWAG